MHVHPLYHITHIYLNEQLSYPASNTSQQGNYLVFWWKGFALGHFFIEPSSYLSEDEYYEKIISAIHPAVTFYAEKQEIIINHWQQWIRDHQFELWTSWMDAVFSPLIPDVIFGKVPVSVVICTRNRATQLKHCLYTLAKQTCLPEEIIVVDNAPEDDATHEVVKLFREVVYVKEPRPGLDIARNAGILKAGYPIIAFVDDDAANHPLWLYNVWETFREPTTAAMTGLVITSELHTKAQYIFEKYWSFNRGYTDKFYDSDFFYATLTKGPPVWEIGAGANMAFRKNIFEKVGLFNELLDAGAAGCSGDSEMWYRILMHGHKIHYNPRAIVFHEHRKELKGLKNQIFYYMRGHAAAALIQQKQQQNAGYKRYLAKLFFKSYSRAIIRGFPGYQLQYSTLWAEMSGILSGLIYYFKNRKRSGSELAK